MADTQQRHYLVLISIVTPTRQHGQIPAYLAKVCTESPTVIWSDSKHIGMACTSEHVALDIYSHLGPFLDGVSGLLVVELGRDWAHHLESKASNWLGHRLGFPLPSMRSKSRRRTE